MSTLALERVANFRSSRVLSCDQHDPFEVVGLVIKQPPVMAFCLARQSRFGFAVA